MCVINDIFIPWQYVPFPEKPALHSQVKEPTVSLQVALSWQLSLLMIHSSISVREVIYIPFNDF